MRINVVHIRPANNVHADGLREVAETVHYAALALGHDSTLRYNDFDPQALNVVIGWHLLSPTVLHRKATDHRIALYNLEQLTPTGLSERLIAASWSCMVYDYSKANVALLEANGAKRVALLELGHVDAMTRLTPSEPLTDVLFYGSINARRTKVLDALRDIGLEVTHLFGVYGRKRDDYLECAKVVLCMHYYDAQIFEVVRCSYAWSNRIAVVAERNDLATGHDGACLYAPYDGLVDACTSLVNDSTARSEQAQRGYDVWSQKRMEDSLRTALDFA